MCTAHITHCTCFSGHPPDVSTGERGPSQMKRSPLLATRCHWLGVGLCTVRTNASWVMVTWTPPWTDRQTHMTENTWTPPWTDRQTHMTENIIFQQLRWQAVKICQATVMKVLSLPLLKESYAFMETRNGINKGLRPPGGD